MQRTVKVERLLADGIIREGIEQFNGSFASQEYKQASAALHQILQSNSDRGTKRTNCSTKTHSTAKESELFNLIPFIGERGTGKTSAMLSFATMLGDYAPSNPDYKEFFHPYGELCNCNFVVLQHIDASLLKRHEDIMTIILSRMVKYFKSVIEENAAGGHGTGIVRQEEIRQLYQAFESVFNDLLNMAEEKGVQEGTSGLKKLMDLNSSYSVAERFQRLVSTFLEYIGRNGHCSEEKKQYLVISLDDIDLYNHVATGNKVPKSAYTLLEQVYEYLQIPGVIVLATYDEARLRANCREYLKQKYKDFGMEQQQANAFLEKIILPKYKIYMPRLNLADYAQNRQLKFQLGEDWAKEFFGLEKGKEFSQKELILNYVALWYGVYFDSQGQKQHFFEMETLRRSKNQFAALRISDGGKKASEEQDAGVQEQRYMKLLSYIYNQFASEKLGMEEARLLKEWLRMPIGRRSREILGYIREKRGKLSKEDAAYWDKRDTRGYSYGDLLQNLYWSSRRGIFSKELVHCILASYSIALPRLTQQCLKGTAEERESAYKRLRQVMGTSIAGQWSNEILYTIFETPAAEVEIAKPLGVRSTRIGSVSTKRFDEVVFSSAAFGAEDIKERTDTFQSFVRTAELFGLLFTNVRESAREEQKDRGTAKYSFIIESKDGRLCLKPRVRYACFNILNFVVNSFMWEDYFAALHDSMAAAIYEKFKDAKDWAVTEEVCKTAIQRCSLRQRFQKWSKENGVFVFPIQHFDMTYNILKHQRDGEDHGLPVTADPSKLMECCQTVYENLAEALEKQDGFYGLRGIGFEKVFRDNPFVRCVAPKKRKSGKLSQDEKEYEAIREDLKRRFAELASVLINEAYMQPTRDWDFAG